MAASSQEDSSFKSASFATTTSIANTSSVNYGSIVLSFAGSWIADYALTSLVLVGSRALGFLSFGVEGEGWSIFSYWIGG